MKDASDKVLGVVMDPIERIDPAKDTTLGLMAAAMRRGWQLRYFTPQQLYLLDGRAWGNARDLRVSLDEDKWFEFSSDRYPIALAECDAVLLRSDPPVDLEYIYTCHILSCAQADGVLVVNDPESVLLANEKIFAQTFSEFCPPTLVSRNILQIIDFIHNHTNVVVKPLNQMGGKGIFRLDYNGNDADLRNAIEAATHNEQQTMMIQRLIPDYDQGDKRILLIDGKPVPYALLRIPPPGQLCANLAAGGRGEGVALNDRDYAICDCVGEMLAVMDLLFVGIDVVGGYLTEVNVTSPTCMRELNRIYDLDIGSDLMQVIENQLKECDE